LRQMLHNPAEWAGWGKPSSVKIIVGLLTGRATRSFPVLGTEMDAGFVRDLVKAERSASVGFKYGATFIAQQGHWHDETGTFVDEPGVQVIVYYDPNTKETWEQFVDDVKRVAGLIVERLAQKAVIVEVVRDGVAIDVGQMVWKDTA